jgi:hypothetical protein
MPETASRAIISFLRASIPPFCAPGWRCGEPDACCDVSPGPPALGKVIPPRDRAEHIRRRVDRAGECEAIDRNPDMLDGHRKAEGRGLSEVKHLLKARVSALSLRELAEPSSPGVILRLSSGSIWRRRKALLGSSSCVAPSLKRSQSCFASDRRKTLARMTFRLSRRVIQAGSASASGSLSDKA